MLNSLVSVKSSIKINFVFGHCNVKEGKAKLSKCEARQLLLCPDVEREL